MKKTLLALALAAVTLTASAQDTKPVTVTVNAKGDDVRSVIHDLFKQSGKNFVLNPGVRFVLYLSLDSVKFDDALGIVCKNASLKYEQKDGIYYISQVQAKVDAPKPVVEEKPTVKVETPKAVVPVPVAPVKPRGTLPTTVLGKIVTTRLQKREIREVMATLSQQSGVAIEVSADVPAFKLDAFLLKTSLRFALDEITRATGLSYEFTDNLSIKISKKLIAKN